MKHTSTCSIIGFLGLAAGTTVAMAQDMPRKTTTTETTTRQQTIERKDGQVDKQNYKAVNVPGADNRLGFRSMDKFRGMNVKNPQGADLGNVNDVIIDRGSGRITQVVIKSGGLLGIGGRTVVVPYESFGWSADNDSLILNYTEDQIKGWPEFDAGAWKAGNRDEKSLHRTLSRDYTTDKNRMDATKAGDWNNTTNVRGKINRISRQDGPNGAEEVIVFVTTDGNKTEQIVLGPSWYMGGNNIAIYRDAPIDAQIVHVDRDGKRTAVARSMSVNDNKWDMYDDKGSARWHYDTTSGDNAQSDNSGNKERVMPFVLSSEMDGKKVSARGEEAGEVDDLILAPGAGRIAFISIDPNDNFMGMGDTKHLVPWSVAMGMGEDSILIDADKNMISSSLETPSDFNTLNNENLYRSVYRGYNVQEPDMNRWRSRADWSNNEWRDKDRDHGDKDGHNHNDAGTPQTPRNPR